MPSEETAIAYVVPGLDGVGGIQVSSRIAMAALSNMHNARLRVLNCGARPHDAMRSQYPGNSVIVDARSKAAAVAGAWRMRRGIRLVLIWHPSLLRLVPFLRTTRSRVAVFLHGIEAWRKQDWLTRRLMRGVDVFLSNSDFTWGRFVDAVPAVRGSAHQTVRLGIGDAHVETTPPIQPPAAIMVGRIVTTEDYKGHRQMIQAWPTVLQLIPDAQLWIVGDGNLRPELEHLADRYGVASAVRFWGEVSEEHKQQLIEHAHCMVLPSRAEGFGLVYLEAMRLGRPCLVSTIDAGREVVNPPEAGLAANPDDCHELADATCRLLTNGPEWNAWSRRARERYEQQFTARHFQQRLVSALEPFIGETVR